MNDFPNEAYVSAGDFVAGEPHPSSLGERILFTLQQEFGYFYDFHFNVAIGCDRGFDGDSGHDLGIAWITPDLAHHEAKFAVEIDGIQHLLPGTKAEDEERDTLLAQEGWKVLRIPHYEVCNRTSIGDVLYRIQSGVMRAIMDQDLKMGTPLDRLMSYPIGVECARCGFSRPGHRVGEGALCIDCLAGISDGPYRPPAFKCGGCPREMNSPSDLEAWYKYEGVPASFECPSHLDSDWLD